MSKIIKIVVALVLVLVLAVAGLVAFGLYSLNALAKTAIEQGGTYAMGVPTKVDSVRVGVLSGTFGLSNLQIANPAGYSSPHFLKLGSGDVKLDAASLNSPVITLPNFALADIDVNLQRREGSSNYQAILDHIKKVTEQVGGSGGSGSSAPAGQEKKLVINLLTIKNVKVHADLLGAPGALAAATTVTVPIDEIKLQNVGQTGTGVGGTGVTVAQLTSIIVQAVLNAAAQNGGGILPADLLGDLGGQLANLDGLKGIQQSVISGATAKVEELGKKVTEDLGKQVGGEAGKALEGLKGLIPGKKPDEPKKP